MGEESLRRNGVALIVKRRVQSAVIGCNLKSDKVISVHFQGKPFNITVIQVYAQPLVLKKLKLNGSVKTSKTLRTNNNKKLSFSSSFAKERRKRYLE